MVGERNPDSVLFRIQGISGGEAPPSSMRAGTGKASRVEPEPSTESAEPVDTPETVAANAGPKPGDSGLVNVRELLAGSERAAPISTLVPPGAAANEPAAVADPAPASRDTARTVMMIGATLAVLVALSAVALSL